MISGMYYVLDPSSCFCTTYTYACLYFAIRHYLESLGRSFNDAIFGTDNMTGARACSRKCAAGVVTEKTFWFISLGVP